MQASKKQSYSLLQRPHSSYLNFSKNSPIKKKCSCTQTDNIGQPFYNITNFVSLSEEFQESYTKAIRFLNNCHDCMNKMILANYKECGDSEPDSSNLFKIPKIPNYFSVLLLFLNKFNQNAINIEDINTSFKNYNATLIENKDVEVQIEDPKQSSDCEIIFDKKDQNDSKANMLSEDNLPKISDTTSSFQIHEASKSNSKIVSSTSKTNISSTTSLTNLQHSKTTVEEKDKTTVDEKSKIPTTEITKDKLTEFIQEQVRKEISQLTSENKLKNNLKIKQKENDETTSSSSKTLMEYVRKEFSEVFDQIVPKNIKKTTQEILEPKIQEADQKESEDTAVKIADISPENLDLMEYSLKKLRQKLKNNSEHKLKYRMSFSECEASEQDSSVEEIFENCCKRLTSLEGKMVQVNVDPKSAPSKNTQKVNEMFQKISKESLTAGKPILIDEENKNFDGAKDRIISLNDDEKSDDDSVILNDDEYERKMINNTRFDETGPAKTLWRTESFGSEHSAGSLQFKKYHPLQLTEKDLSHVDDKILKTIGIFTTSGFIKPEVIDTIEAKEKLRKIKNQKNKQFRTKRKLELEVRYKPNRTENSFRKQGDDLSLESSMSEDSFSLKSAVSYSSV